MPAKLTTIESAHRTYLQVSLAIAAIIYSCTLTYPFNNDNALYAYMADLLLHGKLPYIGSWDQNFPGVLIVHAVPLLFGLRSQFAFHVWDILLQLLGSYFIFRILVRLFDPRTAMLGVVLVALYYVQQGLWMAGERDTYVTLCILAAFDLTLEKRRSHLVIIGILIGIAILFRPTYGLYAIGYLAWLFFYSNSIAQPNMDSRLRGNDNQLSLPKFGHSREGGNPSPHHKLLAALKFALGVAAPIVLVLILYAIAGGLGELWSSIITFNFKVYGGHGDQFPLFEPIRFYAISLPAVAIGIWIWWRSASRRFEILWALFFLASVISLIILYRHSVYHYHPAMVLFIMMSAIGWQWIAEKISRQSALVAHGILAFIILFFAFQTFRGNTIQQVARGLFAGDIHSIDQMYSFYEGSSTFGEPVQRQVGEYLKAHTSTGDVVQMFGPYSFPQYFAKLTTASRFQTAHAILMRGAGDTLQPFQKNWRKEYLADMTLHKPVYFIVCDAPEAFRQYYGGLLGHEVLAKDFTELGDWLGDHYHPETAIGAFTLYRAN